MRHEGFVFALTLAFVGAAVPAASLLGEAPLAPVPPPAPGLTAWDDGSSVTDGATASASTSAAVLHVEHKRGV